MSHMLLFISILHFTSLCFSSLSARSQLALSYIIVSIIERTVVVSSEGTVARIGRVLGPVVLSLFYSRHPFHSVFTLLSSTDPIKIQISHTSAVGTNKSQHNTPTRGVWRIKWPLTSVDPCCECSGCASPCSAAW
jgi:hypothetical protein